MMKGATSAAVLLLLTLCFSATAYAVQRTSSDDLMATKLQELNTALELGKKTHRMIATSKVGQQSRSLIEQLQSIVDDDSDLQNLKLSRKSLADLASLTGSSSMLLGMYPPAPEESSKPSGEESSSRTEESSSRTEESSSAAPSPSPPKPSPPPPSPPPAPSSTVYTDKVKFAVPVKLTFKMSCGVLDNPVQAEQFKSTVKSVLAKGLGVDYTLIKIKNVTCMLTPGRRLQAAGSSLAADCDVIVPAATNNTAAAALVTSISTIAANPKTVLEAAAGPTFTSFLEEFGIDANAITTVAEFTALPAAVWEELPTGLKQSIPEPPAPTALYTGGLKFTVPVVFSFNMSCALLDDTSLTNNFTETLRGVVGKGLGLTAGNVEVKTLTCVGATGRRLLSTTGNTVAADCNILVPDYVSTASAIAVVVSIQDDPQAVFAAGGGDAFFTQFSISSANASLDLTQVPKEFWPNEPAPDAAALASSSGITQMLLAAVAAMLLAAML